LRISPFERKRKKTKEEKNSGIYFFSADKTRFLNEIEGDKGIIHIISMQEKPVPDEVLIN